MISRQNDRSAWLLGFAYATAVLLALSLLSRFHFTLSDDTALLRTFQGYWGGEPSSFSLYVHTLFALPLCGLSRLLPSIPWYSVLLLSLIWLAHAVTAQALARLMRRLHRPMLLALPMALAFTAAVTAEASTSVTYTVVSAMLGSAAVFEVFAVDFGQPKTAVRRLLLSVLLLALAYCLRQISVLPPLAFWLGALLARLTTEPDFRAALRPTLRACLIGALVFAAMMGLREADIALQSQREALRWQQARIRLIDYADVGALTDDALAAVGWSEAERSAFQGWYMLEDNMTADAFDALTASLADAPADTDALHAAWRCFLRLTEQSEAFRAWMALLLLGAVYALVVPLLGRERRAWVYWSPVGCVCIAAIELFYLGVQGRMPVRVGCTVLFPALAAMLCLMLECTPRVSRVRLPHEGSPENAPLASTDCAASPEGTPSASTAHAASPEGTPRVSTAHAASPEGTPSASTAHAASPRSPRAVAAVLAAALIALPCVCIGADAAVTAFGYYHNASPARYEAHNAEAAYARAHPDTLFVQDLGAFSANAMFPDMTVTENLLPLSGWDVRTNGQRRVMARFGLDADAFSVTALLRDDVRLLTDAASPGESLLAFLAERCGYAVRAELTDQSGDVRVFRIVAA